MIDLILIGTVLVYCFYALTKVIGNRKKGKCSCGCEGCSSSNTCGIRFDVIAKEIKRSRQ